MSSTCSTLGKPVVNEIAATEQALPVPVDLADSRRSTLRLGPWHGWLLSSAVAGAAYATQYLPFPPFRVVMENGVVRYPVGAAVIAIVMGVVLRNLLPLPRTVGAGSRSIVRWAIPGAIVLIGAGLNLGVIASIGLPSLIVVIGSIAIALGAGYVACRALGLSSKLAVLLSAGTAICGNSAILAIAPVIKAREKDMLVSIGTVNLLGLAFMLLLPSIGGLMGMSPEAFGVWAGASIHSVPQAVAAGFAYPGEGAAGEVATLAKLVRVAMLAPLVLIIVMIFANGNGGVRSVRFSRLVPWFIWGFLALAVVNTVVHGTTLVPELISQTLTFALGRLNWIGGVLLTLSMAAIGLDVDLRQLSRAGGRAILAGLIAVITLAAGSFSLIAILL
jgi:uncharacterized integral membrane protein (TIGR00698 family)